MLAVIKTRKKELPEKKKNSNRGLTLKNGATSTEVVLDYGESITSNVNNVTISKGKLEAIRN